MCVSVCVLLNRLEFEIYYVYINNSFIYNIAVALPVRIFGNYPQLSSCGGEHDDCYRPSCNQSGVAFGVICQGNSSKPKECEHLDVRLVDGSRETEGRLEICANGYWSNVCTDPYASPSNEYDSYWNDNAALLVCHKLGFPTEGIIVHKCMLLSSSCIYKLLT